MSTTPTDVLTAYPARYCAAWSQRNIAVALGGLGSMGVQEVKPVLAQLARSTDDDVQYVATEQLHRLGAQ